VRIHRTGQALLDGQGAGRTSPVLQEPAFAVLHADPAVSLPLLQGGRMFVGRDTWVTIRGFDRYEVNPFGQIRRKDGKPIATSDNGSTVMVRFPNGVGRQKCKTVAHLVADAFLQNPLDKPYVWHRNGIYSDNRASNLEWVTREEFYRRLGANNNQRKTVLKVTVSGDIIDAYGSITEAARLNYISASSVRKWCLGVTKDRYINGCTFVFEK
jgi:hypothetical protein